MYAPAYCLLNVNFQLSYLMQSTDEYIDYENFLTPGKELVIGKVLRKNKNWLSFRCRYYRMVKEVVNKFSGVIQYVKLDFVFDSI